MAMPSNVTYRTLEQGNEYVWPFLDFIDSGGLIGKEFRIAESIMPEHITYAKEVVSPLNYAMNRTYQLFFPFFEKNNPNLLLNHLLVIGNTQIYFESDEFMNNSKDGDNTDECYYAYINIITKSGQFLEQGFHFRAPHDYVPSAKKSFFHEFAHAGIHILCTYGNTPYPFIDYSFVMHELFAQTIEDPKGIIHFDHKESLTAQEVRIKLNRIEEYSHLTLQDKLRFLLDFTAHDKLERYFGLEASSE